MYTVLRFEWADPSPDALRQVGGRLNAIRPGSFDGPMRRGHDLAIDVCCEREWSEHVAAAAVVLAEVGAVLAEARRLGAEVTLDTGGVRW